MLPDALTKLESEKLVQYLPLVKIVVNRILARLPEHVDKDDLHSAGIVGLIAAIRKFNRDQEDTFYTYAEMRIRGAVLDELRRLDWSPRRARIRANKMKRATRSLGFELGRDPTEKEIADRLGLNEKEYKKWQKETRQVSFIPIDFSSSEKSQNTLHDVLTDDRIVPVQDVMEQDELGALVASKLSRLSSAQKFVIEQYYVADLNFAEIASVLRLTESRVCQIHAMALINLRRELSLESNHFQIRAVKLSTRTMLPGITGPAAQVRRMGGCSCSL